MNPVYTPSFYSRFEREIKSVIIMSFVLVFGFLYAVVGPVHSIVDKAVVPAVAGITVLYGKMTSAIYRFTRVDLGFVSLPADQEFLFSVRLATYINERQAGPLLDIAVDTRMPQDKRERALNALLKFENTSDWIQPFLNELPNGGLLGLYDEKAPHLDELIRKIRSEGGIRQPLVRAYAEVVFSFMLQSDLIIRKHAANWLSDVLAEDAIFLLIPRFDKETEPEGREAIEKALYEIRAISDPVTARELLLPHYKKPAWPSLRIPLAVVLTRLRYEGSAIYVRDMLQSEKLSKEERILMSLAQSQPNYPRELKISEKEERLLVERQQMREEQRRVALIRREQIMRQEHIKKTMIARAEAPVSETQKTRPQALDPQVIEQQATEPPMTEKQVVTPTKPVPAAKVDTKPKSAKQVAMVPVVIPAVKSVPNQPVQVPSVEKTAPKGFPVPGTEKAVEPEVPAVETAPEVLAYAVPSDDMLPPADQDIPQSRSLMNYVDMVFEVKDKPAPLYKDPGDIRASDGSLPMGTKGKASYEVKIGEDTWYQVKTKKGNGWVNGNLLSIFNLSPENVVPAVAVKPDPASNAPQNKARKESTYFIAAAEDVPTFEKPSEKSKETGILQVDTPYMAVKSEKVGVDRWFNLQIRSGVTAWVRGFDLQLADVQQPVDLETPTQPLSQRGKVSSFAAEWVKATVKGVGVYSKPSITAKMITQIDPTGVYKVLEMSAGSGKEWYRIELPKKKEGYVQTMDVSLTKAE